MIDIQQIVMDAWESTKGNEFFQGGFLLGLLAWIGMQLKSIPLTIWGRIDRHIRYVAYLDNTSKMYPAFAEWFYTKYPTSFKRVEAKLESDHSKGNLVYRMLLRQYEDLNFVWYRRWYLKIKKSKTTLEAAMSVDNRYIESYTISSLFGRRTIRCMLDEALETWNDKHKGNVGIRAVITDKWADSRDMYITAYKPLSKIFIDGKDKLVTDINNFMAKQPLYKKQGIKFKRGYLLYGPPGTGKTTLVFGIADWLDMPIYYLNPAGFTSDDNFQDFVAEIPPWSIILIEDVDIFWTNRDAGSNTSISFQSLLNVLDGLHSPNDVLIFMTTNKEQSFDEAFLRKGRLDYKMKVDHPSKEMAEAFISDFYNKPCALSSYEGSTPMVDIQDACIKNDDINSTTKLFSNERQQLNNAIRQTQRNEVRRSS